MELIKWEGKKLIKTPALWILFLLFIAFDLYYVHARVEISEDIKLINEVLGSTGIEINDSFMEKYNEIYEKKQEEAVLIYQEELYSSEDSIEVIMENYYSNGEYRYFDEPQQKALKEAFCLCIYKYSIEQRNQYYEGFDIRDIKKSNYNMMKFPPEGTAKEFIDKNYEQLQDRVEDIIATGEKDTAFFTGTAYGMHSFLFSSIFMIIIFEIMILTSLITIYSLSYEFSRKTDQLVYSTKSGRKIMKQKWLISLIMSMGAGGVMLTVVLSYYFYLFPYSNVWNSYISSSLNTEKRGLLIYPFITWKPLTVKGYLLGSILTVFLLIIIFALLSGGIELLVKQSYLSFLGIFCGYTLLLLISGSLHTNTYLDFATYINPVVVWLRSNVRNMEGGLYTSYYNFERITISLWICLGGFFLWGTGKLFKKQNL